MKVRRPVTRRVPIINTYHQTIGYREEEVRDTYHRVVYEEVDVCPDCARKDHQDR